MELIDSHAHLTHERLAEDAEAAIERARAAGVVAIVTVASSAADAARAVELASRHEDVFATAGVHPHEADSASAEALSEIRDLLGRSEVVAVGETGLDYHYDFAPREVQRTSFAAHLEMARDTGLPVVVHSRSADEDTRALIAEAGEGVRGVLHCFSAGRELLELALGVGWSISFTGLVSFRNYDQVDLLRSVPLDRIMVETDSPYMAPMPHRGKRNEPAFVREVLLHAARLRGEAPEALAAATTRNARRFFGLTTAEAT